MFVEKNYMKKYLIISDIHGDYESFSKIIDIYNKDKFKDILILGDLLYHGPRNPLPRHYDTKKVYELANQYKDNILMVKGNCDSEVDQMVLCFKIHNYKKVNLNGYNCLLVHGHHLDKLSKDELKNIDIVFYGHTHVHKIEKVDNTYFINPGSISLPKENQDKSYIIFNGNRIDIISLDGKILDSLLLD